MDPTKIFGDRNAKLDRKLSEGTFVNTHSFCASTEKNKYLLRGFKGSGKTALLLRLQMCGDSRMCNKKACKLDLKFCDKGNFEVIYIEADKLQLNKLLDLSQRLPNERSYGMQEDIVDMWTKLCKIKLFEKIPELKTEDSYKQFLKKTNFVDCKLDRIAKSLLDVFEKSIVKTGATTSTSEIWTCLTDPKGEYQKTEKKARELLREANKSYYIIFDGFDHFIDRILQNRPIGLKRDFVKGLARALIILGYNFLEDDFSLDGSESSLPNVYVKVLLPEDFIIDVKLRDDVKYLDPDKYVKLRWRKDDLKKFITARMDTFLKGAPVNISKLDTAAIWNSMFGKQIRNTHYNVYENSFDYVLRHTLLRPRDLQVICSAIVRSMDNEHYLDKDQFIEWIIGKEFRGKRRNAKPIPEKYVKEGVSEGSKELVNALYSEFEMIDLKGLLSVFLGKPAILSYGDVYNYLKKYDGSLELNLDGTITILFRIGFFGKFIRGDKHILEIYRSHSNIMQVVKSGEYYLSIFSFAGHHETLTNEDNLVVSPVFTDALKTDIKKNEDYLVYPIKPESSVFIPT